MLVSSFCASRLSDATRRMRATGLLCAAPSQQHYNLKPISTQLVVFVASLLEVLLAAPRGGTRRHLEGGRELRAASAPSQKHQLHRSSQQQKQATAVSRDDERSTGALLLKLFRDANSELSPHFPIIKHYSIWKDLGVTHPVRKKSFKRACEYNK